MPLTCISCKMLFSVPELHREHYKSDWHRYNLKRKLAELPPLTKDEFEEKAAVFLAVSKEKEKVFLECNSCHSRFSSNNAMANHLKSRKHLDNESSTKINKLEPKHKTYTGNTRMLQEPKTDAIDTEMVNEDDDEWSDLDSDWESDDDGMTKVVDKSDCLAAYELVLPSGATIGHRSLARYYKQNLKPISSDNEKGVKMILQPYKALGYTSATGSAVVKRARNVASMQKAASRYNLKLGMKNNRFQPHFRRQVMF